MRKQIICLVIMGIMSSVFGNVFAHVNGSNSDDRSLKMVGSIVPGTCKIQTLDPDSLEFEDISLEKFKNNGYIYDHSDAVKLEIDCTASTSVAINIKGENYGGNPFIQGMGENGYFPGERMSLNGTGGHALGELGNINGVLKENMNGNSIGIYQVIVMKDGVKVQTDDGNMQKAHLIRSTTPKDGVWQECVGDEQRILNSENYWYSWSIDSNTPVDARRFSANLNVRAIFRPPSELDISQRTGFSGSATVTLTY